MARYAYGTKGSGPTRLSSIGLFPSEASAVRYAKGWHHDKITLYRVVKVKTIKLSARLTRKKRAK